MSTHKIIFWISNNGIQLYRMKKNKMEMIRYQGNDRYPETSLKGLCQSEWFKNALSISKDDYIDFCFLSENMIDSPLFNHFTGQNSSWTKEEVEEFCKNFIPAKNYKVLIEGENSFVLQTTNIYDEKELKLIYLKCIPPFSLEMEEKKEVSSGKTSILYQYYKAKLDNL